MIARRIIGVALALVCTAEVARSQSLGQVAEQEATRRQRVTTGKQYTNDNLKPESQPAATPSPATPAAAPSEPAAAAAPTTSVASGEKNEKPLVKEHRDEAYWRGRVRELKGHMTRLQGEIKALESRVDSLAGDPNELNVTQNALSRLRTNLRSFTQEFENFQARGRRANVPADWLQ